MAVLAEGISVIVRLDAIARLMDDEWASFVTIAPNQTLCCDNELARVGFMHPKDVEAFVRTLELHGLRHMNSAGEAVDLVVVDQLRGPMSGCDWVEWGTIPMNSAGERARACRLKDGKEKQLFTPEGWEFKGSLSQQFGFHETDDAQKRLRFLRTDVGTVATNQATRSRDLGRRLTGSRPGKGLAWRRVGKVGRTRVTGNPPIPVASMVTKTVLPTDEHPGRRIHSP